MGWSDVTICYSIGLICRICKKNWKYLKFCISKFILFKVSYVITLHGTVVRLVVSGKGEIKTTVVELARNIKPFDFEFASSN